MNFLKHSNLEGKHAFLGASNYHWLGYDEEKLITSFTRAQAVKRGSELHEYAEKAIRLKEKQIDDERTIHAYINDAIDYAMTPEQILYYSSNCFGTADAISFRKNKLRIHDLKTGVTPAKMDQLLIYEALFCLEYRIKPADIEAELRIYQNDDILVFNPDLEDIVPIMDKIVTFDKIINELKAGGLE